jgi:hypothetical protein
MAIEVVTLVRLPISEAVEMLRQRHNITEAFNEVRLEDDFLAFYFVRAANPSETARPEVRAQTDASRYRRPRTRRARKRRNRMKTRGWPIVTKIVNAKGQTAVVYKPFVDALSREGLSRREQRATVKEILRANGNKPTEASIDYFLNNTLEYISKGEAQAAG